MSKKEELQKKKCPITFGKSDSDPIRIDSSVREKLLESDESTSMSAQDLMTSAVLDTCATANQYLALHSIDQATRALPHSMPENDRTNLVLQSIAELQPEDAMESRLISQMAVLHSQGMTFLHKADLADMKHQAEFCITSAIKLLRLHRETLETYMRYKRGSEHRVIVQHVNVSNGGQAVVAGAIDKSKGGGNG